MSVIIGTSGWQYSDWRGRLYPRRLAQREWLTYYSDRFQSVEVNNVFYRLPEKATFERWAAATPEDFTFSLKASRYLTHVLRLSKPTEPVRRLLARSSGLGNKVGPILLQLPANFHVDAARLASTLAVSPSNAKVAFEPRHESWYTDEVADILKQHGAAFCLSDTPYRKSPLWRTADWGICGYMRPERNLLRATAGPPLGVGPGPADLWGPSQDVYVYFNNDHGGCAVRDAHRFALAVDYAGRVPTRVPTSREASLIMEHASS